MPPTITNMAFVMRALRSCTTPTRKYTTGEPQALTNVRDAILRIGRERALRYGDAVGRRRGAKRNEGFATRQSALAAVICTRLLDALSVGVGITSACTHIVLRRLIRVGAQNGDRLTHPRVGDWNFRNEIGNPPTNLTIAVIRQR